MKTLIDERRFKSLLKESVSEVIEERKEIFYDIFSDALEDITLHNAIREGEKTKPVGKDKIMKILTKKRHVLIFPVIIKNPSNGYS